MTAPIDPIKTFLERIEPKGIIHVGASEGQEFELYRIRKIPVLWFEPLQEPFNRLNEKCETVANMTAVNLALGDNENKVTFHQSDKNGVSSSVLMPTAHLAQFPARTFRKITVNMTTLDNYMANKDPIYDTLILDVQGYEKYVLNGAVNYLKNINHVIGEVWHEELYANSTMKSEIDTFLSSRGFVEVKHLKHYKWFGNSLYSRV